MRPAPAEELSGMRAIIDAVAGEARDDEYLRAQLRLVSAGMAGLAADWERAPLRLAAENAATEAFLRELAPVLGSPALPGGQSDDGRISEANERHQLLRGLLGQAILDLDAAGESGSIVEARRRVRAFLLRSSEIWTG